MSPTLNTQLPQLTLSYRKFPIISDEFRTITIRHGVLYQWRSFVIGLAANDFRTYLNFPDRHLKTSFLFIFSHFDHGCVQDFSKEGFMWRHMRPNLRVIILATIVLVSSSHWTVLGNTTKCSVTFYLVHITKFQLSDKNISTYTR